MQVYDYTLTAGDLEPPIQAHLTLNGLPIPYDAAMVVELVLGIRFTGIQFTGVATLLDQATMHWEYAWVEGDTLIAGRYDGLWRVTYPGDRIMTLDNDGYFSLFIQRPPGR
jgi:hypothetical protein